MNLWRRALSTSMLVAVAVLLPLGVIGRWAEGTVFESGVFSKRAVALLDSQTVRHQLAEELTAQLARSGNRQAVVSRPAMQLAVEAVIDTDTFRSIFRTAVRRAHEAVEPTLQAVRSIPTLAWGPMLLLWLGIEDLPKVVLVAIGAFFPVYVNLVSGILNVDRKLIEVARIYNLSWSQTARRVILPAALPNLFTGMRLGFSQAWLFVVVAEIFGATKGLGFRLTDSQLLTRVDLMLVAMLVLAVLGKVTDTIILAVQRRALRWRDTLETESGR